LKYNAEVPPPNSEGQKQNPKAKEGNHYQSFEVAFGNILEARMKI